MKLAFRETAGVSITYLSISSYIVILSTRNFLVLLRFQEIENCTGGKIKLKPHLVGACDSNADVLHFIAVNHNPRSLSPILSSQKFPINLFTDLFTDPFTEPFFLNSHRL